MISGNPKDFKISEIVAELKAFCLEKNINVDMHLYGRRAEYATTFDIDERYVTGEIITFVNRKTGFTFRWSEGDRPYSIGIRKTERLDDAKLLEVKKALKMIILMKANLIAENV